MENTNRNLVEFCKDKLGTPYIMGTNGKVFTQSIYDDLCKRNPGGWFVASRRSAIRAWIGKVTTDCHGLVEWFIRKSTGESYDVTADGAYKAAEEKGDITNLPELPGVCVRYPGHVGVYIGDGLVVEARGFDYGVCITELAKRPWTRWYKHPRINYMEEEEMRKITKGMNTEQIQRILSAGGSIECESGTYDITAPLILSSNTRLNLGKAVFRQGAAIHYIFATQTAPDTIGYNGAHDIEIYGGIIEGMGKYKTKLNLITIYHARNIHIHDVTLQDVVGFHHIELNASSCITIENCTFAGYNALGEADFRECIQLDAAVGSALVIHPLGSKCYDGATCENIVIRNNRFKKSESRPAPSNCIGNHCQHTGKHRNIIIEGNTFTGGNQSNPNGICINLVGMENVQVRDNTISGFGRGVRAYSYDKSYTLKGEKVDADGEDGICSNVQITGNTISEPTSTYLSSGIWVTAKNGRHESITIKGNTIKKSGKMKYAVDMNYCDGGYVVGNESKAVVKVGSSCVGVMSK